MGKVKDLYRSRHIDESESIRDYYLQCYVEKLIEEGKVPLILNKEEEIAQDKYMRGELCNTKDVPIQEDTNSKSGQYRSGLKLRRPRSKKWKRINCMHYGMHLISW